MSNALIIGGSNGVGLSIALSISEKYDKIYIVDKVFPDAKLDNKYEFIQCNLVNQEYDFLDKVKNIEFLFISVGIGRVIEFEKLNKNEIFNLIKINVIAPIAIIKHFYDKISSNNKFYCGVMVSISAFLSSPLFSVYSGTKAFLHRFIESINIELEMTQKNNRVLDISPASIKGTNFGGGKNDLSQISSLTNDILENIYSSKTLFIPDYETMSSVIKRYEENPHNFGVESYKYKINQGRLSINPQLKIGYLSGTFDLFHIGHLNMLKKAKEHCDYLVIGVHKDASHKRKGVFIPLDERKTIVKSIKYVDDVIDSLPEDVDIYKQNILKYDYLFVGSDYKGTDRFLRYEDFFKDKDVNIIYFPYTQGTSSTQLRTALDRL